MENILVIGGGLMGTAVTWKLADRGAKVTLLEQQGETYLNGSSYGTSRISRSLGPKKDVFSCVHNKTVKEVKKLIAFLNDTSPKATHKMEDIYTTTPVSYLYEKKDYAKIKKLRYKKQRNDFRMASQHSAFRKFGITIPDNTIIVREKRKYSGTLNPTELLKKLRTGIKKKGGTIKFENQVIGFVKNNDIFEVSVKNLKTKKTTIIKAKKVILAAGAYNIEILKDFAPYLNKLITPKKVAQSFFKIKDERYKALTASEKEALQNGLPFFSQIGKEFFALFTKPSEKGKSPIIKAGGHQKRRNIHDLEEIWNTTPQKKERKWIKKQFRKHLKMLEIHVTKKEIETVESYNCVYSETRTRQPIVSHIFDQHGSLDNSIALVGGMSGIGAKGCLGYAILASDLMLGKAGKVTKMYKKQLKTFGNPSVNLHTKRTRRGRLF